MKDISVPLLELDRDALIRDGCASYGTVRVADRGGEGAHDQLAGSVRGERGVRYDGLRGSRTTGEQVAAVSVVQTLGLGSHRHVVDTAVELFAPDVGRLASCSANTGQVHHTTRQTSCSGRDDLFSGFRGSAVHAATPDFIRYAYSSHSGL